MKLLLVGAGETGKTTLFRQLSILYGSKKAIKAEKGLKEEVDFHIIRNMKLLVGACESHVPVKDNQLVSSVLALGGHDGLSSETAQLLERAWKDEGVQATWKARADTQVQDTLAYFMSRVKDFAQKKYVPSIEDILRLYTTTSGSSEADITVNGKKVTIIDVGGRRDERRTWIKYFSSVDAILYVAALSEYDQVLCENDKVNRQAESLELFKGVCSDPKLTAPHVILFLNKSDVFRQKLKDSPFVVGDGPQKRNTDFHGKQYKAGIKESEFEAVYNETCAYIVDQYGKQNAGTNKKLVSTHIISAVDTATVKATLDGALASLLKLNMEASGGA